MYYSNNCFCVKSILTGYLFFLLAFILSACSAETPQQENEQGKKQAIAESALEFAPGLPWLNVARPLTFDDLQGKVIILDFWTYGCINCIHVLADLKRLEKKYGHQLLVIGVHTPKFDNEKNLETLRNIVVRYGIEHPVVNDVDSMLAAKYGMRAWPTRVVIGPDGTVLGRVTGEGRYDLFDQTIAELLDKHGDILDAGPIPLRLERDQLSTSLLAAPGKITTSEHLVAISDTLHHRIIITDHLGSIQQVFGGKEAGSSDGTATSCRFNSPQGLVFSEQGLYVADTGNHLIRYIDLENGTVKTIAGNGKLERHRKGEFEANQVGLASPWALALQDDLLYIAMAGSHQIWLYDTKTGRVGPYAGSGREGIDDGDIQLASFSQPSGLTLVDGWLYVADSEDSAIRRINLEEQQVETLVGTGLFDFGDKDGAFAQAKLQHVLGIVAYSPKRLLIADTYNHKLKLLDLPQARISTLAGNGQPGNSRLKDGSLQLNEPGGLALLGGKVLIADTNNHRILAYDIETQVAEVWEVRE